MGPSMIGQRITAQPVAKHKALLGVSSSRFWSVSRGVQSAHPNSIFTINYKTPSLALTETRETIEIAPRRTAHEGMELPPNAPDGLVVLLLEIPMV
jgi:hypothetical protein